MKSPGATLTNGIKENMAKYIQEESQKFIINAIKQGS